MKRTFLLLSGLIILLFVNVFLFTRPSFISCFDLTNTGTIGDTIGGITAPVLNLLGSLLVYIAFKEQVRANTLITQQINEQKNERNFQVVMSFFRDLKEDFRYLSYEKYKGQGAINAFIYDLNNIKADDKTNIDSKIEDHLRFPVYHDLKFVISEYNLIIAYLENSNFEENEKSRATILIKNFYHTQLEEQINILIDKIVNQTKEKEFLDIILGLQKFHQN